MNIQEYIKSEKDHGWVVAKQTSFSIGDDKTDGMHHHFVFIDDGTCPFGGGMIRMSDVEENDGKVFVVHDITSTITGMSQDILNAAMAVGRRK